MTAPSDLSLEAVSEVLTDLATQLELFLRVDADRAAQLGDLTERVDNLQEAVRRLVDRAATAATPAPATPAPAMVRRWRRWSDQTDDERRQAASDLREWVDWLITSYRIPLGALPPCWWQHPGLVHELTALWWAHQSAYLPENAPEAALQWHEALARAVVRWPTTHGGCKETHLSLRITHWVTSDGYSTGGWG